jgi:hypothetical protein
MPFTGYWANIVAYTVSRLVHETDNLIDLGRIWKEQKISPVMEVAIDDISRRTWSHITHPYGGANVTQYCKQQKCWTSFLEQDVYISAAVKSETITGSGKSHTGGRATAETIAFEETSRHIKSITAVQWFSMHSWAKTNMVLNGVQLNQIVEYASYAGDSTFFNKRKVNEASKILSAIVAKGYTISS